MVFWMFLSSPEDSLVTILSWILVSSARAILALCGALTVCAKDNRERGFAMVFFATTVPNVDVEIR